MTKSRLLVFMISACLLTLAISPIASLARDEQTTLKRPGWEYKKTAILDEATLNELGGEGWELVAVEPRLPYVEVKTVFGNDTRGSVSYTAGSFYFKRPK